MKPLTFLLSATLGSISIFLVQARAKASADDPGPSHLPSQPDSSYRKLKEKFKGYFNIDEVKSAFGDILESNFEIDKIFQKILFDIKMGNLDPNNAIGLVERMIRLADYNDFLSYLYIFRGILFCYEKFRHLEKDLPNMIADMRTELDLIFSPAEGVTLNVIPERVFHPLVQFLLSGGSYRNAIDISDKVVKSFMSDPDIKKEADEVYLGNTATPFVGSACRAVKDAIKDAEQDEQDQSSEE